jgi:LL-diaminopimelate aminotransferase
VDLPKATFYVWMATPPGMTSMSFAAHLLEQAGIVVIPGIGLGWPREGYVRLALTVPKVRMADFSLRPGDA